MAEKRNLCAMIPIELHERVRQEQAEQGKTLSEYVEQVLKEHFEGGKNMAGTKTLAFQISEDLMQRLKDYLDRIQQETGRKMSQKEFIVGLIERALDEEKEVDYQ